jgi:hypothetical protein
MLSRLCRLCNADKNVVAEFSSPLWPYGGDLLGTSVPGYSIMPHRKPRHLGLNVPGPHHAHIEDFRPQAYYIALFCFVLFCLLSVGKRRDASQHKNTRSSLVSSMCYEYIQCPHTRRRQALVTGLPSLVNTLSI